MTDVLRCRGVHAGYRGQAVVRGVDLDVAAGEVVALLGPNGAGKTTLLLTISGLLRPIDGTIEVLGEPVGRMAPERIARLGVAHVPDDRALFGGLSTVDNLEIGARPGGMTVDEAFELFPRLAARRRVAARQLSGGEQQMLVLCRALSQAPKLLVVDEMSMGLAPALVQALLPVLRTMADERHVAVLMVEQHVHLALEVADRACVLDHGDVVLSAPAARLQADPALLESAYLAHGRGGGPSVTGPG